MKKLTFKAFLLVIAFCTPGNCAPLIPLITTQPVSASAALGSPASLTAGVSGQNLHFQWLKDGAILPGQTGGSISFGSLQLTNCGNYQLVATNTYGMAITLPASLSVPFLPLAGCGANYWGQLANAANPQLMAALNVSSNVVTAAAGDAYSLFVTSDGTLWGMGYNNAGQLGIGTMTSTNIPVAVASNVLAVAAGYQHALLVKSDGTLWAWGSERYGQLGDGTTNDTTLPINVASNVVAVAAGLGHSLFIGSDGTLWAMGNNQFGQLGNGTAASTNLPVAVASNVVAVAAGGNHSLFLKTDGTLWAMGQNSFGQLGNGGASTTNWPTFVTNRVTAVAAGNSHSLFIQTNGILWGMGLALDGELGVGPAINRELNPVAMATNVTAAAGGGRHSVFIKGDGTIWATGAAEGNGTNTTQYYPLQFPGVTAASLGAMDQAIDTLALAAIVPQILPMASQTNAAGQPVTFTLNVINGSGPFSYQWQFNGVNIPAATNQNYNLPAVAFTNAGIYTGVATGMAGAASNSAALSVYSIAITNQPVSAVVVAGSPVTLMAGASGISMGCQWLKDRVILPGQTNSSLIINSFQFADCGNYQMMATNLYGTAISYPASLSIARAPLQIWGNNSYGQLGSAVFPGTNHPISVASNLVAVAAGSAHSMLVKNDGTLWTVGYNRYGQLGNGTTNNTAVPVSVASNVVMAAAGQYHSLFVKSDGSLWVTGRNNHGQLGRGVTTDFKSPLPVLGLAAKAVGVAAGAEHSLFVSSDGTLWAMGLNHNGQLGNGTTTDSTVPIPVATNVAVVAAGAIHSLFLKTDDTLWAMGANADGQLGVGTTNDSSLPLFVSSNVVAAAAGAYHSLFVKDDGTLWVMGLNSYGQLGNGSSTQQLAPMNVAGNVAAVAAGASFSLFVKRDGTLWAMGENEIGELGIGNTATQYSPVQVPGMIVASLGGMELAVHAPVVGAVLPQMPPLTNQTVIIGQPAAFALNVTNGTGPFTYQWQFNGTNVSSTGSRYTITAVTAASAGTYTGTVTGMAGGVGSGATLTVSVPFKNFRSIPSTGANGSQLLLQFAGATNYPYSLQTTTNLTPPIQWQSIFTNPADASGNWQFTDTNLSGSQKFYRALAQ
jgi:alpha-tubulin suppressor-like RCC1 family protein